MKLLIALVVALASCVTTPPKKYNITKVRVLPTDDKDKAWNAILALFAAHNWPIANMEKASGFIASDRITLNQIEGELFADCGKSGFETPLSRYLKFNFFLRSEGNKHTLTINTSFSELRNLLFGAYYHVQCTSRGTLEMQWIKTIYSTLKGKLPAQVAETRNDDNGDNDDNDKSNISFFVFLALVTLFALR